MVRCGRLHALAQKKTQSILCMQVKTAGTPPVLIKNLLSPKAKTSADFSAQPPDGVMTDAKVRQISLARDVLVL